MISGMVSPVKRQAFLAAVLLAVTGGAYAQQDARAARLSDVDGQVQLSASSNNQIMAQSAPLNTPVFEGTRVATAEDGRAELQFDDGSIVRVSPNSSVIITVLRQEGGVNRTELQLENGLAYFELQGTSTAGNAVVRFGPNAVTASGFTVFRLDLDNPPGSLAVFSGNAHLENSTTLALDLHGGESARLTQGNSSNYVLAESIEPNSWDAWNADRDQQLTADEAQRTQATVNVPDAANPAWSSLDANGNWYNVPGVGNVWSPYAATNAGWDPYGCGYWVWTAQYGYVWASCYPWGYMPYAGGSWAFYDGVGWGWNPGGGGWWWNSGGWGSNVTRTSFQYSAPHRPHGGPISPGHGNPGSGKPVNVVAVNRFHSGGETAPVHPRSGPVTVGGVTLQPLRPVAVRPSHGHEPTAIGTTYSATNSGGSTPRSGAVAAPSNGFNHSPVTPVSVDSGIRPVYAPGRVNGGNSTSTTLSGTSSFGGRPAMPSSGFNLPHQPSGSGSAFRGGSSGGTPRPSGGGSLIGGGGRPSGGGSAPSMSGGAVHSGGGASFGGGGAVHSGGGASMGGGGGMRGGGAAPAASGGGASHK
jgi:hypothetical protein